MNGKELKRKRLSLGLSQTALAEVLRVKPFTVSRWEADTLPIPKTVEPALEAVKRRMKTHGRADTKT